LASGGDVGFGVDFKIGFKVEIGAVGERLLYEESELILIEVSIGDSEV
jgi:hypothetical protein